MRPEDKPKAIGLVVGVVVVFSLVFIRMKSALGGGEVPQPAQSTVAISGSGANAAPPPADAGAAGGSTNITIGTGPGPGAKGDTEKPIVIQPTKGSQNNPFRAFEGKGQKPDTGTNPDIVKPKPIPPITQPTQTDVQPPAGKGGALPVAGNIPGMEVVSDTIPDMQVTGILTGARAVAVIRMNGKTYVVTQGETFANGFKLISASGIQVTVSQGLLTRTIKMDIPMG